ncbi:MAG: hypothetical protein HQK92_14635, partial [Nitrospirae bacterium]|nr:hypothetical protein [Nitrospirota bacterium]
KEWFESFCKKFDEKTCAADSVTLSRNRVVHLLIQIRPQFPNNIKNTYSIQINKWTNTGKNNVIPNENNAKYHDVTFDQIPKIIDDLLCSSFVSNINLERLEFFLPSNLVFWDVDQYNLKELTFRKKLGQNYEIVIRINRLFVDDALKNPAKSSVSRDWRKRWDILQNRMGTFDEKCIKHICDINGYCAENVFDEIDDEDIGDYITCLEIAFRPKTKEDEKDLVNLIWESGIPVAVLHRKSYNSLNSTLELPENTKIINKETISDLPNTVRKIRRKAKGEQHIGNHLTLIWDDPYKTVTFNDAESLHYINKT